MNLLEMKKRIEEVRDWALKNNNTKNGLDYRVLFKVITGKDAVGQDWKNRKDYADYSLASYAYGVYSLKA